MAHSAKRRMMIFSGSSNRPLSEAIAGHLGQGLGKIQLSQFADGEIFAKFDESIRGTDLFLVQTLAKPVNTNFMELLVMADAAKRASAAIVNAVIPYFAYARQDKKMSAREPITSKMIADILEAVHIDRVITMDLHAGQIQGFFNVPVDHMTALPILAGYFAEKKLPDLVCVSPDVGRMKLAKDYADQLDADLAVLHKSRPAHNVAEITHLVGSVEGKTALLIDDMIDTAGTLTKGAEALMANGAREVYACATHPILSGPAIGRLESAPIKEVVVTDTIIIPEEKQSPKIVQLSIAELFAHTIKNVYEDTSVSQLFETNHRG